MEKKQDKMANLVKEAEAKMKKDKINFHKSMSIILVERSKKGDKK